MDAKRVPDRPSRTGSWYIGTCPFVGESSLSEDSQTKHSGLTGKAKLFVDCAARGSGDRVEAIQVQGTAFETQPVLLTEPLKKSTDVYLGHGQMGLYTGM